MTKDETITRAITDQFGSSLRERIVTLALDGTLLADPDFRTTLTEYRQDYVGRNNASPDYIFFYGSEAQGFRVLSRDGRGSTPFLELTSHGLPKDHSISITNHSPSRDKKHEKKKEYSDLEIEIRGPEHWTRKVETLFVTWFNPSYEVTPKKFPGLDFDFVEALKTQEELDSSLRGAVEDQNRKEIEDAIEQGADPSTHDTYNKSVLLDCCEHRSNPIGAHVLLANGADPDRSPPGGDSPLTHAAMWGHEEIVADLISAGVEVNRKGNYQRSALTYAACSSKNISIARMLIEAGADVNAVAEDNDNIAMEMIDGIGTPDIEILKLLAENGLDLNYTADDGRTALKKAATYAPIEYVEALLDAGAELIETSGGTALDEATRAQRSDVMKLLMDRGGELDPTKLAAQLESAIGAGDLDLVKDLVEKGADVNYRGDLGDNSLHDVAYHGGDEILDFLLASGADINSKDGGGESVLHRAARSDRIEMSRKIIDAGVEIDSRDNRGNTPMMMAAYDGHLEMVKALLELGADLAARNKLGWDALMQSCEQGRVAMMRYLIEQGSDVHAVEKEKGATPLMIASTSLNDEAVQLLLDNGADPNKKSKEGKTAAQYGEEAGEAMAEAYRDMYS